MWRSLSLLLVMLAACRSDNELLGGEAPEVRPTPPPPATPEKSDAYRQNYKPTVDVLWVVDNSSSMDEEQTAISTNFPAFMAFFLGSNLDYHIGVVSTNMQAPEQSGKLTEKLGYRWIDPDTTDPEAVFSEMAELGVFAGSNEEGVLAGYAALELQTTYNQGFLRDDSSIHVVIVSDEPDYSPETPISVPEFIDYLNNLRPEDDLVTYNTIVNPRPPDNCPALAQDPEQKYIRINEGVGGVNWSVCSGNWIGVLEALGLQSAGLKREYFLSDLPVPHTVEVRVVDLAGVEFEFSEFDEDTGQGDWTYDSARNSVTFVSYVPDEGATVYIDYLLLSALEGE